MFRVGCVAIGDLLRRQTVFIRALRLTMEREGHHGRLYSRHPSSQVTKGLPLKKELRKRIWKNVSIGVVRLT